MSAVGRRLATVVLVASGLGAPAGAEEVLLLVPRDFDVRPSSGWYKNKDGSGKVTAEQMDGDKAIFRFRGTEVTQRYEHTDHHSFPECSVDIHYVQEIRATFVRGVLEGRWTSRARNYYRSCKDRDDGEYLRANYDGVVTGQSDADGRLQMKVEVVEGHIIDRRLEWVGKGATGRFVAREWKERNQAFDPWSYGCLFQLPVGELQSSQKLSTPAAPPSVPAAGPSVPAAEPTTDSEPAADVEAAGPGEVDSPDETTAPGEPAAGRAADRAEGAADSNDGRSGASPPREPAPPTPGETAAATVGSGLLVGLGAWLLARANGAGLGDVLGGLGGLLAPAAEPPPPPEPVLSAEPPHADMDMRRPDDLGRVAGAVAAGDRRIAERRESIARRDAEIRALEDEVRRDAERIGADAVAVGLQEGFREGQRQLLDQGYRVVNPGYDQALPVQGVTDAVSWVVYNAPTPGDVPYRPVRCEQAADLGIADAKARLHGLLGDDAEAAIVDLVKVDVVRDSSLGGQLLATFDTYLRPRNHVATRVTLPDGRRYVLDYWEGMRGGEPQMVSEAEWRARWKGRLGADGRFLGSGDYGQQLAEERVHDEVRKAVSRGGTKEQGLEAFRRKEAERVRGWPISEAEKAARLKQVDTMVKSYRRAGRFNDLD